MNRKTIKSILLAFFSVNIAGCTLSGVKYVDGVPTSDTIESNVARRALNTVEFAQFSVIGREILDPSVTGPYSKRNIFSSEPIENVYCVKAKLRNPLLSADSAFHKTVSVEVQSILSEKPLAWPIISTGMGCDRSPMRPFPELSKIGYRP
ncbi:hypothetical protein [Methylobacterium sp. 88A]|uniref:hypothetical protein n=1 Tax=Methylobacterium sp. 88A TaxID=1131813 RepID=UPI0012F66335|nr:hypothetical protein [Methylobacterium sp. 88A]